MKNLIFTVAFFLSISTFAQVLIDDTGSGQTPHSSVALEVKSNSRGMLFPRLSSDPTGVAGLIYFNTTFNRLKAYDGTNWKFLVPTDVKTEYKLSIKDALPVFEGKNQNFLITLTPPLVSGDVVTVDFTTNQTNPVSATEGTDYTKKTGTLTFNTAGETTKQITVKTLDDTTIETIEKYTVDISNATVSVASANVSITKAQAIGEIDDNDNSCTAPKNVNVIAGTAPNNINEYIYIQLKESDLRTKYDLNVVSHGGTPNLSTPVINDVTLIPGGFPTYTPYFYVSKSNPYNIMLTAGNTYDVYLRKDCGGNNTNVSRWVKKTITIPPRYYH